MPDNGLVSVQSHVSVRETLDRFLAALAARKLTVFARVDHAAGAASAGLPLRPTEVVIFGNPKGGTALMQTDSRPASTCRSKRLSGKMPTARPGLPITIRRGSRSATASGLQARRR